jgi:hypothetical protein
MSKCTICSCDFDVESEGGIEGVIGTFVQFSLCPTCYNGMCDMVEQTDNNVNLECPECGTDIKVKIKIDND